MSIESLYPQITEAILHAEKLEDLPDPGAAEAFLRVSQLEEKIAKEVPASNPEGALARRGAVRAAISAQSFNRARQLVQRYLSEQDAHSELRSQLQQLAGQVETQQEVTKAAHSPAQPFAMTGTHHK